jgi:prevent-host-death family protein
MRVGTKELKNRLSHYLRRVRAGEPVFVMDRNQVIAEIRAVASAPEAEETLLDEMAADGTLTRGSGRLEDFKPVRPSKAGALSELVIRGRD